RGQIVRGNVVSSADDRSEKTWRARATEPSRGQGGKACARLSAEQMADLDTTIRARVRRIACLADQKKSTEVTESSASSVRSRAKETAKNVDDRPLTYGVHLLSLRCGPAASRAPADYRPRDSIATAGPRSLTGIACRARRARSLVHVERRTRPAEYLRAEPCADCRRSRHVDLGAGGIARHADHADYANDRTSSECFGAGASPSRRPPEVAARPLPLARLIAALHPVAVEDGPQVLIDVPFVPPERRA